MSTDWILDAVLIPVGVLLIAAYNVSLYYRVKWYPLSTVIGVNHLNRNAWVRSIMRDVEKKNILAVQTLRNSIMASTLLASTAMVLSAAIAAFVSSTTTSTTIENNVVTLVVGSKEPWLITVKFFSILLCFVFSFMCHVQSIRYTNHVNFLITIPMGPDAPGLTPEYVSSVLALGSNFYTIGTRGFYCAFPLLLWLFGPIPMVVACAALVPTLYQLDSASGFGVTLSAESRGEGDGGQSLDGGGARRGAEASHHSQSHRAVNGAHAIDVEMESSPCLQGSNGQDRTEEKAGGKPGVAGGVEDSNESQHGRTLDC